MADKIKSSIDNATLVKWYKEGVSIDTLADRILVSGKRQGMTRSRAREIAELAVYRDIMGRPQL